MTILSVLCFGFNLDEDSALSRDVQSKLEKHYQPRHYGQIIVAPVEFEKKIRNVRFKTEKKITNYASSDRLVVSS